jgi:hypothetical protein
MKIRTVLLAISISALIVSIVLISVKAYYVAIALIAGVLLFGHRELWFLLKNRRLPPFDERIHDNIVKAVRNAFIFTIIALAFLMLPFTVFLISSSDTANILGGLFVSSGAVYVLSYLFYDRIEPKLAKRELKMLKIFMITAGISLATFILGVFLHNALSALFKVEEPVFFIISVFIAPLGFAVGIIGSLVIFIYGLFD